jgi:microcystin degradation protein MlrC
MRRRLLLVLCVLAALACASVAAGSGAGAKYKVTFGIGTASCSLSCPMDVTSIVIRRIDDDRTSCRPFVDSSKCKWTAPAGTKVVLETTADPPLNNHNWSGGDCFGTGKCVLIMDSNKIVGVNWSAP